MKLIPLLISVLPGLAQQVNQAVLEVPEPYASNCSAKQIQSMTVTKDCDCWSGKTNCRALEYTCPNPDRNIRAISGLNFNTSLGPCFYDDNASCNSCYLWFHNLCSCIQKLLYTPGSTNCKNSTALKTNNPVWMLLEDQRLITTTLPLSGIEKLQDAGPHADAGWSFAQTKYKRGTQALAMNSMASRTEEQIHIHVCDIKDRPCYPSFRTREILSCLSNDTASRAEYKNMKPVPLMLGDTKCKVADHKGDNIDIVGDIELEIRKKDCKLNTGAGIITDSNNFTWACLTDSTMAAEYIFCN